MTEETGKTHGHADCMCCQATEVIGRMMRVLGPSEEAAEHFRQSRLEFLKGIRKVLDDQIERAGKAPGHKQGSRIVVE